ncbi:MAG: zinc ABC transporter substrate-binding protein [Chloroflexi bacterium]|nr:zinc ABC transporter substrate-binding protein [Chloroflexota bacterium]
MLAVIAIGAACATDSGPASTASSTDVGLRVVTTVSPITSLAENIGGTRIALEGIIPEGTNSHTFEPVPSVARLLSQADIFILNGLFLEEPSLQLAKANMKQGAVILSLGDRAINPDEWIYDFSFPESGGSPNPHLWTDPILALKYAELISEELIRLDSENSDYYAENFSKLKARIEDLDERIKAAIATIPEGNRKLLTYHDSFPHFGTRYGMEIIGAVQPSDFSELSARDVANLIDQVRDEGVPAIFGSEVFQSPVMEQVAKESGARFIDELRDDDLPGLPGDPRHTYLGLMVTNMEIMIPALGGNVRALEGFDTGNVFEGESRAKYPQ